MGQRGSRASPGRKEMKIWAFFLPPESVYTRGWTPVSLGSGWGGGAEEKPRLAERSRAGLPQAAGREFVPLRAATFVLGSGHRAAARRQCARAGGAGAGRVAGYGTAPRRPGPLHPGTAELASCRGTTFPRPSEIQARAGGNIVPAGRRLALTAATARRPRGWLRGAPSAWGPCAGPRQQPRDPAQLAGQPEELGWPRARRLSSPSPAPLPLGRGEGGACSPPGRTGPPRLLPPPQGRATSREQGPK